MTVLKYAAYSNEGGFVLQYVLKFDPVSSAFRNCLMNFSVPKMCSSHESLKSLLRLKYLYLPCEQRWTSIDQNLIRNSFSTSRTKYFQSSFESTLWNSTLGMNAKSYLAAQQLLMFVLYRLRQHLKN